MARKNLSDKELQEMPFEKALARLEEVVAKMEQGELPLEEMLTCYEEGNRLSRHCEEKLQRFEKKIELLTKENSAGGEWTSFDPEDGRRMPSRPDTDSSGETNSEEGKASVGLDELHDSLF